MVSPVFNSRSGFARYNTLFLAFWAVLILNDVQRQERERRKRNQRFAAPCPF